MATNYTTITDTLAWTLIHSIWQGAIVFLLTVMYLMINKNKKAAVKFNVVFLALLTLFLSVVGTFFYLISSGESVALHNIETTVIYYIQSQGSQPMHLDFTAFINNNSAVIANFWLLGFAVFLMKYILTYVWLFYMESKSQIISLKDFGIDVDALKQKMGIVSPISIKDYSINVSPFTAGAIKPVIYFPLTIMSGLDAKDIEAILVHEMEHIRRKDYLINLITSFIEIMMYYHPVVWWLQRQLSVHRENACDDAAIAFTGQPLNYAKALLHLQEKIHQNKLPSLAMAFTGSKKKILLNRIKRIFNMPYSQINIREKLLASMVLFLLALGFTKMYAHQNTDGKSKMTNEEMVSTFAINTLQDTIPKTKKREAISILKSDGDKEIELKMENGSITKLKIDGEIIPPEKYDEHRILIDELRPRERSMLHFGDKDVHIKIGDNFPGEGDQWEQFSFSFPDKEFGMHLDSMASLFEIDRDSFLVNKRNFNFKFDTLGKMKFPEFDFPDLGAFNFKLPDFPDNFDFPDMDFNIDVPDMDNLKELYRLDEDRKLDWIAGDGHDDRNFEQLIGSQLNRDGFLIANKENKIELSGKSLKINGEKQASNIWNKYKNLFERETGLPLTKETKLIFNVMGKEAKRKYKSF